MYRRFHRLILLFGILSAVGCVSKKGVDRTVDRGVNSPSSSKQSEKTKQSILCGRERSNSLRCNEAIRFRELRQHKVLTIERSIVFDTGSARVRRSAWPTLDEVARILARFPKHYKLVVGAVDRDEEVSSSSRKWRLSTQRAINVIDYVTNYSKLNQSKFIAAGSSSHDLLSREYVAGTTRRVDIHLLKVSFPGTIVPVKEEH